METLGGVLAAMEQERLERLAEAADILPKEGDEPSFKKYRLVPRKKGLQRLISEGLPEEERKALFGNMKVVRGG